MILTEYTNIHYAVIKRNYTIHIKYLSVTVSKCNCNCVSVRYVQVSRNYYRRMHYVSLKLTQFQSNEKLRRLNDDADNVVS